MTNNMMVGRLVFDRTIDSNKHYISLGGFEVKVKGLEQPVGFDFESFEGSIVKDGKGKNSNLLDFVLKGLDFDSFPESKVLLPNLENIECFTEFFVYTGEDEEDDIIIPLYVEALNISLNAGKNERDFDDHFCERINVLDNRSEQSYGIYDLQLGFQRDEEYESYIDALIGFGEHLRERMIEEEDEEYKEQTSKLPFREFFEAAGYQIIPLSKNN